jgi:hypothetical protein
MGAQARINLGHYRVASPVATEVERLGMGGLRAAATIVCVGVALIKVATAKAGRAAVAPRDDAGVRGAENSRASGYVTIGLARSARLRSSGGRRCRNSTHFVRIA